MSHKRCQNRTFWDLLHVAADGVRLRYTIGVAEPFGIVPTLALDPTTFVSTLHIVAMRVAQ
jgi:hypothetical protein